MLEKIGQLISEANRPLEFGFEKEFLLQAIRKNNGAVYNLNIAPELLARLACHKRSFAAVEEYSKCLIEIVSDPYVASEAIKGLRNMNNEYEFIQSELEKLVVEEFPLLAESFSVRVTDSGTSAVSRYVNGDGSLCTDQEDVVSLVLPRYKDFVDKLKDKTWQINNISEKYIGVYNHLNSFHITFHPSYNGTACTKDYIRALSATTQLVNDIEHLDIGNRTIQRASGDHQLRENLRDVFLKRLSQESMQVASFSLNYSSDKELREDFSKFLTQLLLAHDGPVTTLDAPFKSWSACNLRPRIIADTLPAIEIRRFGSSFSKTQAAQDLINTIIKLDSKGYHYEGTIKQYSRA